MAGAAVSYAGLTLFFGFWFSRYFLSLLVLAGALAALAQERLWGALEGTRFATPGLARLALLSLAVVGDLGRLPVLEGALPEFQRDAA